MTSLLKRGATEAVGSAFLLAGIVGSGIMAERLSDGNASLALLANTLATAGILMCLIAALAPISGAHFNPAVSIADAIRGALPWGEVPVYLGAQLSGAIAGVVAANTMFGLPMVSASHRVRGGPAQWFAEFVATFGLLLIIWGCTRFRSALLPLAVAAYIASAYWFTSSTSFANPAVTIARSFSDTFSGIRPQDAPKFILAQIAGAVSATLLFAWLLPRQDLVTESAPLPHDGETHAVA